MRIRSDGHREEDNQEKKKNYKTKKNGTELTRVLDLHLARIVLVLALCSAIWSFDHSFENKNWIFQKSKATDPHMDTLQDVPIACYI